MTAEVQVEVLPHFLDVVDDEAALRCAAGLLRETGKQGGDGGRLGRAQVAYREIFQEGVRQDFTMSVCDISRTGTGACMGATTPRTVKRDTRPVLSLPPWGLGSCRKFSRLSP
jgi:hypothetical protein